MQQQQADIQQTCSNQPEKGHGVRDSVVALQQLLQGGGTLQNAAAAGILTAGVQQKP
jgi:hypothetical protein